MTKGILSFPFASRERFCVVKNRLKRARYFEKLLAELMQRAIKICIVSLSLDESEDRNLTCV